MQNVIEVDHISPNHKTFLTQVYKFNLFTNYISNNRIYFREDLQNSDAGRDVLIKKAWETR